MADINPTISINTLNVNGLNTLIKARAFQSELKKKIQLYVAYKKPL